MLMRWSDDRLKSNYHRVRMPRAGEYLGPRYSLAWFNQARPLSPCLLEGNGNWCFAQLQLQSVMLCHCKASAAGYGAHLPTRGRVC